MSNFTEMDCYLFGQATHYDIYRKMGAHVMTVNGESGVCFDVWAPHADSRYWWEFYKIREKHDGIHGIA